MEENEIRIQRLEKSVSALKTDLKEAHKLIKTLQCIVGEWYIDKAEKVYGKKYRRDNK